MLEAENDPAFVERLKKLGVDPVKIANDDFAAVIKKSTAEWGTRVTEMGLTLQ